MNRELQQVRRYWPRSRYAGWNWHGWQSEDEPGVLYMRYSSERLWWRKRCVLCLDEEQGGWHVVDSNQDQIGRGDTIAEAMRAAGFGVRPLGKHARERVKRSEYRKQLIGYAALGPSWAAGAARLLAYYQPRLADRQRPRKGARLGRRKRRRYDIGEPWYGLFPGGDPRLFTPDPEWCTPAEIARHAEACEQWNRGKRHDRGPSCLTNGDGSAWRGDGFGIGMVWWSWKDKRKREVQP